jgi:class 3 adenylate cyclase
MQRATAAAEGDLELRVGLEAGEPVSDGEDLYGTPVIIASRLCDIAGAGERRRLRTAAGGAGTRDPRRGR